MPATARSQAVEAAPSGTLRVGKDVQYLSPAMVRMVMRALIAYHTDQALRVDGGSGRKPRSRRRARFRRIKVVEDLLTFLRLSGVTLSSEWTLPSERAAAEQKR